MARKFAEQINEALKLMPTTPGVYQFLNKAGEVIYVGKAKNLKRRVSSYFVDSQDHSIKVKVMVGKIAEIRHIDTATEQDALLLENSMIKSLKPRYNILLKDDKTYPWIVIHNEPFPRVESTRRVIKNGSVYFGPYASVTMQKSMLEFIRNIYPLRTCRLNLSTAAIDKQKYRVCLQYHLGNCKGPCVGAQSEDEYAATIDMVKKNLRGDLKPTKQYLEQEMMRAAEALNFEVAARYKTKLAQLDNYAAKSIIVSDWIGDVDIFSLLIDDDTAYCNFVRMVSGSVVQSFTVQLSVGAEDDEKAILTQAIIQISDEYAGRLSHEVIVPFLPEEERFEGVKFTVPQRGDKLKLLEFSQRGAKMYHLEKMKNLEIKNPEKHTERVLAAMQRELHLDKPPRHIECFDNSNLQGTYPVASCVVFRDGRPSRKEYRHFNIKTVVGPDDFASMREIIFRRYTRLLAEKAELPDLIIVDGGKGQLSSAYSILKELGLESRIPIVGLAKRIEEIFFPNDPLPYYLDRTGEPLRVVMHLRDEAHRFGITFHRNKRSAGFIQTDLESIEGVGKITADKLLKHFRSVKAIRSASREQLAEVIGNSRAEKVFAHYHSED
ncbi:MAG: excinuclease ABC subunit C [Tidjanibacter sp.]|nr:excinuclease ABC subunit C [Tidjanibacter sp.]